MVCYGGPRLKKHAPDCSGTDCSGSQLTITHMPDNYRCRPTRRPQMYISPPVINTHITQQRWFYPKPCICNIINALEMRVGKCVRRPNEKYIEEYVTPFAVTLAKFCPARPVRYSEVYAGYTGAKRARYQRAHENLLKQGKMVRKDQSRVKMFVKMEAYKFDEEKPYPDCRAIQFRSFEYTLQLASIIRRAEHKMYLAKDIPGFGLGRHFGKNLCPRSLARELRRAYDSIPGCKVVLLDVSRFDAHVSKPIMKRVEHVFWNNACDHPQLSELLRWKLDNEGSARSGDDRVKYKVRGGRMSGDADTGASNCVQVACALASLAKVAKITKFAMNVNGDDSVFLFEGELSDEQIIAHFDKLGMEVKIEGRPGSFEEIDYCQARPVLVAGDWVMIRNPAKVMTKVGMTHKRQGVSNYLKRVYTTCLGELALARGTPVIQPYLERLLLLTYSQMNRRSAKRPILGQAISESYRLSGWLPSDWKSGRTIPISSETRKSFANAFGISVTEQIRLEGEISCWTADFVNPGKGWPIMHPWLWSGPEKERW